MSIPPSLATALGRVFLEEVGAVGFGEARGAARFVCNTHQALNPLFRAGVVVVAWYFRVTPILRYGRIFDQLSPDAQRHIVAKWHGSILAPKRDFIQFFQSLTMLGHFDSDGALRERGIELQRYRALQRLYSLGTSYD